MQNCLTHGFLAGCPAGHELAFVDRAGRPRDGLVGVGECLVDCELKLVGRAWMASRPGIGRKVLGFSVAAAADHDSMAQASGLIKR